MNRPKFRVWDTEEQKWYKPTFKAYMKELHDIHVDLDGSLLIRTINESGKYVTIHESMFEGRYELLQSTGLKDINGKEIYEGDIVKNKINEVGYIEWSKCRFNFCDSVGRFYLFSIGARKPFEILGNIYEDPHLIEED